MSHQGSFALSSDQKDHFMKYGYLHLTDCFSRAKAASWTDDMWIRLGYSPTDKSTWVSERINMPSHRSESAKTFAPKAWAAVCELVGGEDRISAESATWDDALIVNLGTEESEGKIPCPKELPGWHVHGDFFVHFLDSPEQALLVIPLFSDIQKHGGGTMICPDAIPAVARYLVSVLVTVVCSCVFTLIMTSSTIRKVCRLTWSPVVNHRIRGSTFSHQSSEIVTTSTR